MAEHSNLRDNSSRLRRNMSKLAYRSKEKVMRSFGRVEETKDEILDHYVMLINKQQLQMQKLHRDMKQYLQALKAMSVSQKAFYSSLYEVYDDDWAGKDVIASCSRRSELLHNDIFARFQAEVIELLHNHLTEYQKCKLRVEKRGRKLVDYDAVKRTLQSLEAARKPDEAKIERVKDYTREAREMYEELNNGLHQDLPSLYDSRLPVCINVFSSIHESEKVFSNEVSELRTKLDSVLQNLKSEYDGGEYHIQRMQPMLPVFESQKDNGRVAPGTKKDNPSVGGGSPAKIATSSTVSSSSPVQSKHEAPLPPRSPEDQVLTSPSSNTSTHEYVNLQVGTIPDLVKPVSEEEENAPTSQSPEKFSDIKNKKRPASMYVPSAAVGLSVYEEDKHKAKDDGSGSTNLNKSGTLAGHNIAKSQAHQDEGKQHKGLFGFLGLKRFSKSNKSAVPASPSIKPQPANIEEQECEVSGADAAATATIAGGAYVVSSAEDEKSAENEHQIQDTSPVTSDAEDTSPKIPISGEPNVTNGVDGEHHAPPSPVASSETFPHEVAEYPDGGFDSAFAKYGGSQKVETKAVDKRRDVADSPLHEDDISPSSVIKEASSSEAVEVEAEIRRLSMENDPVFSVAVNSSAGSHQKVEMREDGKGFDCVDVSFGDVGSFGDGEKVPFDEDNAFGSPDEMVISSAFEEGFADAFVVASPGKAAITEDEPFGAEPFSQHVLEDADVALRRVDSVFDEGVPTNQENFSSGDSFVDTQQIEMIDEERIHENIPVGRQEVNFAQQDEEGSSIKKKANDDDLRGAAGVNTVDSDTELSDTFIQSQSVKPAVGLASEPHGLAENATVVEEWTAQTENEDKLGSGSQRDQLMDEPLPNQQGNLDAPYFVGQPTAPPNTPAAIPEEDGAYYLDMTIKETPQPMKETDVLYEDENDVLYKDLDSPGLPEPVKLLKVDLSDDEDRVNYNTVQGNKGSNAILDRNAKMETNVEFPTPDGHSTTADAEAIQPIYEEPPREDIPVKSMSLSNKSPTKSVGSHKYLDLPPNYLFSVEALYQYRSSDDDELTFDKGEIIYIVEHPDPDEQDDGWQMGMRRKDWEEKPELFESFIGVFPENFTKRI